MKKLSLSNKKTFFIIPGFKQKASDKAFSWLIKYLNAQGFQVVKVFINWDRKVMSDYVEQFKKQYDLKKSKINYVLGFSYGAVIAAMSANYCQPKKIYLCSLSPDFKEDISAMTKWIRKMVGLNRLKEMRKRSGRKMAKELKIPTVVFYGEIEGKQYPDLRKRCEETVKLARQAKLVVVKNARHQIDFPEYRAAILKELSGK